MTKWVCGVCGYVYEGDKLPDGYVCPICGAPASKFIKQEEPEAEGEVTFACDHEVGITEGVPADIVKDLRDNFNGECSEVGMYLAMARVAFREGYPEIGLTYQRIANEEADHASRFAEMLGEVVTDRKSVV